MIGEDTPESSLAFTTLFYWIKFKTAILCLKLLTCFILQRRFDKAELQSSRGTFHHLN